MEFDGIREDLVTILALGFGKSEATKKVADLEALIRNAAKKGAEQAIPTIRQEVRTEATATLGDSAIAMKPWIIAALVVSSVALVASAGTAIYVWRKKS